MTARTRQGPTLTLALWDPGRGSASLHAATAGAAEATRLPVSLEDGREEGLLQLHVWAGSLGLGLPGDSSEAWADLGRALGTVAERVAPALALCASEWAAGSLREPEQVLLRPGLVSGWARRAGLDATRVTAFDQLAQRGVVVRVEAGWRWRARGAVPLGEAPAVEADRLAEAVFRAWWGRAADEAPGQRLFLAVPPTDGDPAPAVAAALPDGFRVEAWSRTTVVAEPPPWGGPPTGPELRAILAEAALLVEARWAGIGGAPETLHTLWLPDLPARTAPEDVEVTALAAGSGVLLAGPPDTLADLVPAVTTTGRG